MDLNALLISQSIDPGRVIVFRHRPYEPEFRKVLPWLAAERPDMFNDYQRTQGPQVEAALKAMEGDGYVVSFIGHEAGKAIFVGLYRIQSSRPISFDDYWAVPTHREMGALGMRGFSRDDGREQILRFDLEPTDVYSDWKGKLIVSWPPPERSWWRRAHRNAMPVLAILEDSAFDAAVPDWQKLCLRWEELLILPKRWRLALSQRRGIYFIFDEADGKSYVGSAYGSSNILGRWLSYGATGHGGNALLQGRNPGGFRFTILERVSPDMNPDDVIRLEASWKDRLHTRAPYGLNLN